jgi:DNA-binding response OmpR family regulator
MPNTNAGVTFVSAPRILLIEDDQAMGQTLIGVMERAGMHTAWAKTGADGLRLRAEFLPDVVLVDLNLPDTDGIALVTWLAQHGDCGVIVVSGLGEEADRILGLELGADDYVAKPPQLREMLARIRAVHRRVKLRSLTRPENKASQTFTVGRIRIDVSHRAVYTLDGEHINLTAAEFAALETMLAAKGQPVSRDQLCQAALHRPWRVEDRSVDQLIFNLRHKLPGSDEDGRLIHSIRGAGYLLAAGQTTAPVPVRA